MTSFPLRKLKRRFQRMTTRSGHPVLRVRISRLSVRMVRSWAMGRAPRARHLFFYAHRVRGPERRSVFSFRPERIQDAAKRYRHLTGRPLRHTDTRILSTITRPVYLPISRPRFLTSMVFPPYNGTTPKSIRRT